MRTPEMAFDPSIGGSFEHATRMWVRIVCHQLSHKINNHTCETKAFTCIPSHIMPSQVAHHKEEEMKDDDVLEWSTEPFEGNESGIEVAPEIDRTRADLAKEQQVANTEIPPAIAKWLLLLFILAVLSWVATMSILAGHTDIWREKIWPFFESTYFPMRSGARVFTYLGVFYILAGAVSLSCLALGVRLPGTSVREIMACITLLKCMLTVSFPVVAQARQLSWHKP
jgi:hypothetical protein